ncbi:hypothetical protein ABVK25_008434 [Lepraria finkii]|uniref:Uncharacterized protein n=1 Tax=Lepraria finkii TaxID=1340010 RepID=A0ABR4B0F6_9LECA
MSGTNPFRRKNTGEQSFNSPAAPVNNAFSERSEARIPPTDTDIPRATKTKTGKTVRIISPRSATSEDEHGMPGACSLRPVSSFRLRLIQRPSVSRKTNHRLILSAQSPMEGQVRRMRICGRIR